MIESLEKRIEAADRDGTILQKITNKYTHVSMHTQGTLTSDLDRILTEKKTAQSRFAKDPEEPESTESERADMFIQENLLYQANQIAAWIKTAKEGDKQAFTATFSPEDYGPVGCGILIDYKDNSIREFHTDSMCTVLRKTEHAPLGFTLVTAYPDMTSDTITPTGKDLSSIVTQTKAYRQADTVGKMYLTYITNPNNQGLSTYKKGKTPDDSMMMLHVQTRHPNHHHEIKIKEDDITLKTVAKEPDQYGNLSAWTVKTQYTSQYAKIIGSDYKHVNRVSLTNDKMFRKFQTEFPVIANQLHDIRNQIKERHKNLTPRYNKPINMAAPKHAPNFPRSTDKPKPDRVQQTEEKFKHITQKTIETEQTFY